MSRRRHNKRNPPSNITIESNNGPPCPRCGVSTQVRSHRAITAKELEKPYYYSRWYFCINLDCRTTLIMPDEYKVFRGQQSIDDNNVSRDQKPFYKPNESDTPPWE